MLYKSLHLIRPGFTDDLESQAENHGIWLEIREKIGHWITFVKSRDIVVLLLYLYRPR